MNAWTTWPCTSNCGGGDAQAYVSTIGNNSVIVDGIMRGYVRDGRVVLNFDADRVAELVAQNLGAVYDANAAQAWLAVDPGVDEATFRALFSEAITDRSVPRDRVAPSAPGGATAAST